MLCCEFKKIDLELNAAEAFSRHRALDDDPAYWAEIERDLAAHPEIWPAPNYEDLA